MTWRLLLTPPADGAFNMALDDVLLDRAAATGETVVRVYEWSSPTLSFGRNQRAVGTYAPEPIAARGIEVVRRPTGGRAVLHARELTYSVTGPVRPGDSLRTAYEGINALLRDALRALGVPAETAAPAGPAPRPTAAPCFEEPVHGELMVEGRKLVGSAQWRDEHAYLQHGSVLVDDDQWLVRALACDPLPEPLAPATLRQVLGWAPDAGELHAALADAVLRREDPHASALPMDQPLAMAAAARRRHYLDPAWTWRR